MAITADAIRSHLEYSAWANATLLDAAGALSTDELTRDFNTADHSVLGTLAHLFAADRMWLALVRGQPRVQFVDPERDTQFVVLQNQWPPLLKQWIEWGASLTDSSTLEKTTCPGIKGRLYEIPTWQVVLHVVNHGTHHRGQVTGFLRAMGHTPPRLDLLAYYMQQLSQ